MNWEALAVIGGGAAALFLIVAPLAVWWHRRSANPNRLKEASVTGVGAIVLSGMVFALLGGAIAQGGILANVPGWGRAILAPAYFVGVIVLATGIGNALEKRGYPMSRSASEAPPPNYRMERPRER